MDEQELRGTLTEIFQIVLDLPDNTKMDKVRQINSHSWDSLAQVSLISAMESEFGLSLDSDDRERLTSFAGALLLLQEKIR
jgi:acyl carrier protein